MMPSLKTENGVSSCGGRCVSRISGRLPGNFTRRPLAVGKRELDGISRECPADAQCGDAGFGSARDELPTRGGGIAHAYWGSYSLRMENPPSEEPYSQS